MKLLRKISPITLLIALLLATILFAVAGIVATPASQRPGVEDSLVTISEMLKLGNVSLPQGNPLLHAARITGVLFSLTALWMVWIKIFREETSRWRLRFWSRHVVICGLGRKGMKLAKDYRAGGERRVVVLSNAITDDEEHECREHGILVVRGDASHAETLAMLKPGRASVVIACCGGDRVNLDVAMQCMLLHRQAQTGEMLTCHAHIASLPLRGTLQRALVLKSERQFDLRFFHSHEIIARQLLAVHPLECDAPGTRADDHRPVRLILIGSTPAAEAVLVQAALVAHYSNQEPLRVTLVDDDEDAASAMVGRHPGLRQCCVITHSPLPANASSARAWDFIPADDSERRNVILAMDEDERNVEIAFTLSALPSTSVVRIMARVADRVGLLRLLDQSEDHLKTRRIHIFGSVEGGCTKAMIEASPQDALARGLHDHYYQSQLANGVAHGSSPAMVPWSELAEDFRISNRANADHVDTKLRAIGCQRASAGSDGRAVDAFADDEVELLARVEHNRWCAERWIGGWDHAGKRDDRRKLHPSFKPWSELDEPERNKDRDAVSCLPSLLNSQGWKIVRSH